MSLDRRTFVTASAGLAAGAISIGSAAAAPAAPSAGTAGAGGVLLHTNTYLMPAALQETWSAFTNPRKRALWFGTGDANYDGPEASPIRELIDVVDHPGLPAPTETRTTFKATPEGTLITQTMIGLGDGAVWKSAPNPGDGVAEMMGDLALYLKTGVGFPRHTKVALQHKSRHPNDLTSGSRNVPGGIEILDVQPGTLAAEAGLQAGDIVVALGDIGIYSLRDARVANLCHAPGDEVEIAWIRGRDVHRAKGRMTATPTKWRNGFDPAQARRARQKAPE